MIASSRLPTMPLKALPCNLMHGDVAYGAANSGGRFRRFMKKLNWQQRSVRRGFRSAYRNTEPLETSGLCHGAKRRRPADWKAGIRHDALLGHVARHLEYPRIDRPKIAPRDNLKAFPVPDSREVTFATALEIKGLPSSRHSRSYRQRGVLDPGRRLVTEFARRAVSASRSPCLSRSGGLIRTCHQRCAQACVRARRSCPHC
jgi:hypothetical protein